MNLAYKSNAKYRVLVMTASQLIAKLSKLDPTFPVCIPGSGMSEGSEVDIQELKVADLRLVGREYCDPANFEDRDGPIIRVIVLK